MYFDFHVVTGNNIFYCENKSSKHFHVVWQLPDRPPYQEPREPADPPYIPYGITDFFPVKKSKSNKNTNRLGKFKTESLLSNGKIKISVLTSYRHFLKRNGKYIIRPKLSPTMLDL